MAVPFIPLKLDKTYNLRFGFGASYLFEKVSGIRVTQLDLEHFSIMEIGQLLWAMMREWDKDLTIETVLKLVDENVDDLSIVMEAVAAAIEAAYETKEKPKNV